MMPLSDPEPVESPATADLPAGRRRHRRVLTRRRILIYPCDNPVDGRAIVSLHDFSPRGVSFSHTRLMRPGSQFILRLVQAGGPHVPLLYTVRHCTWIRRSSYRIGAELTRVLGPPPAGPGKDAPASSSSLRLHPGKQEAAAPAAPAVFPADQARGFAGNGTSMLEGRTVIGWERIMDLRREGERIWVHLHPPGKDSGWSISVDAQQLQQAVAHLSAPSAKLVHMPMNRAA